jgi:hypothetical protein
MGGFDTIHDPHGDQYAGTLRLCALRCNVQKGAGDE